MGVLRFDAFGLLTHVVDVACGAPTSDIAFGGPGNRSLFITQSGGGTVLRVEMPFPGVRRGGAG